MKYKSWFVIFGVIAVIIGCFGVFQRMTTGLINTNFGSIVPWGLWEAAYIYFIGLSAGSFLISSLVYVFGVERFEKIGRLSVFTAIVTLVCALMSIWVGLGHMFRVWHVLVFPNFHSMMAVIIWLYSTYLTLLLAEFWLLMRVDFVRGRDLEGLRGTLCRLLALGSTDTSDDSAKKDRKIVKVLGTMGVPLAICFHGGVGALFGVVAARPFWHSGMFPILFLLGALVSGGALLVLISAIFQEGLKENKAIILELGKGVFALLLLDLLFQASEMIIAFKGGIPGHAAGFLTMMAGKTAFVYWVFHIGVGAVIPILIFITGLRNNAHWVAFACFCMVFGFLAVRFDIVVPGLSMEEVQGITHAFFSKRMTAYYMPSLMEWMVTIGIGGFGILLFSLGEVFLPLSHHLEVGNRAGYRMKRE